MKLNYKKNLMIQYMAGCGPNKTMRCRGPRGRFAKKPCRKKEGKKRVCIPKKGRGRVRG